MTSFWSSKLQSSEKASFTCVFFTFVYLRNFVVFFFLTDERGKKNKERTRGVKLKFIRIRATLTEKGKKRNLEHKNNGLENGFVRSDFSDITTRNRIVDSRCRKAIKKRINRLFLVFLVYELRFSVRYFVSRCIVFLTSIATNG